MHLWWCSTFFYQFFKHVVIFWVCFWWPLTLYMKKKEWQFYSRSFLEEKINLFKRSEVIVIINRINKVVTWCSGVRFRMMYLIIIFRIIYRLSCWFQIRLDFIFRMDMNDNNHNICRIRQKTVLKTMPWSSLRNVISL